MKKGFRFRLPNDIAMLMQLAEQIRQLEPYLALSDKCRYGLDLALEEMATNIIKYGYDKPGEEREIDVKINFAEESVILVLTDDGHEFNPLVTPEAMGGDVEERDIGGVGLQLIRNMARSLKYERKNNHNIVTIEIAH